MGLELNMCSNASLAQGLKVQLKDNDGTVLPPLYREQVTPCKRGEPEPSSKVHSAFTTVHVTQVKVTHNVLTLS